MTLAKFRNFCRSQFFTQIIVSFGLAWVSTFVSVDASAREFDFKTAKVSTYFGGSYGTTSLAATPYNLASGNGVSTDKKSSTGASGEVGLAFTSEKICMRLGVEILVPSHQSQINGTNSSGTNYFSLDSQTLAYVPGVSFEYLAYRDSDSHALLGFGLGYAFVTLQNKYAMTAAGQSALGVGSYTEAAHAQTMAAQVYSGYEINFTDMVTASFKLGYRYLPVTSLKSTQSSTTISGAETDGSTLVNMDGGNRRLNLSGVFVGVSFNFYI